MEPIIPIAASPVWLGAGIASLLMFGILAGFTAGVVCAPALQEWALRRARKSLQKLYQHATSQMERSERLFRQLGEFSGDVLTPPQWTRLDELSQQMQSAWRQVADKHGASTNDEHPANEAEAADFTITWQRNSIDPATQLPDRVSLEENLQLLLTASTHASRPSGFLLVSLDKGDQLRKRFGAPTAAALEARLSTVLIKAARDQDLVCRVGPDAFAVLLPSVSPLAGARVAESMRAAVRQHRFHASEAGPEVIVTASFGYSTCLPGDPTSLVLDRAGAALTKSQQCGRNQLHVHDAYHQTVCRVG